jgi:mycoredoxin
MEEARLMSDVQTPVKFYGAMWCGDTRRARSWFDANNVAYEWIDVDKNKEAEEYVKSVNNGFRSIPTIVFGDGSRLTEPSVRKLEEHARRLGLVPPAPEAETV